MSISVELTYDMGKTIGQHRFELEGASTVAEVVEQTRTRFEGGAEFEKLARVARVAVNGVLIAYRKGMKTKPTRSPSLSFVFIPFR